MKNTITPEGAEAIKRLLSNTSMDSCELDIVKCYIDMATGVERTTINLHDFNSEKKSLVEITESQARIIKQKNKEINRLTAMSVKQGYLSIIGLGDFTLSHVDGKYLIEHGEEYKEVSQSDVSKKLRELYYRTEEKKQETANLCDMCINQDSCEEAGCSSDISGCTGFKEKTEEKRSCENCGDKCNVKSFRTRCQLNGFNKWTPPKQS